MDSLVDFNRTLDFERPGDNIVLTPFKCDIDGFFSNIPHELLVRAWTFLEETLRDSAPGRGSLRRYTHVIIPNKWNAKAPQNYTYLKFEDWRQVKPYTLGLRRLVKEKPVSYLSTHGRVQKGMIAVPISTIGEALKLDLSTAVARFGRQWLLQIVGSPQGSPISVFNACLAAFYVEHRAWSTLKLEYELLVRPEWIRYYRKRWVDDLYFVIGLLNRLT